VHIEMWAFGWHVFIPADDFGAPGLHKAALRRHLGPRAKSMAASLSLSIYINILVRVRESRSFLGASELSTFWFEKHGICRTGAAGLEKALYIYTCTYIYIHREREREICPTR
jgi:hypothetical protein